MTLSLLFSEKQWNVREEDLVLLSTFLFLTVLLMNTAWRRKKTGKVVSISPDMSNFAQQGCDPENLFRSFPAKPHIATCRRRWEGGGGWCSAFAQLFHFRPHWEDKIWPISSCICFGKGHIYRGGWGEHHSTAATAKLNPSYERRKTVRKIVCRNPSRRAICATDGVSLLVEWLGGGGEGIMD